MACDVSPVAMFFFIMLLKANCMVELKIMGSPYKENPHEVAQVHTQKSAG